MCGSVVPCAAAAELQIPSSASDVPVVSAPESDTPSDHRLVGTLGFAHWFGSTFGSPDGISTPELSLGGRPGLSWLDLRFRYSLSLKRFDLPDGRRSYVGFASLEVLVSRELRIGSQALNGFVGVEGSINHSIGGVGNGLGVVLGAEYLLATGLGHRHAAGFFVVTHEILYTLPGDSSNLLNNPRRDAQVDLGVVTTLF
jgi:hypothetical protein